MIEVKRKDTESTASLLRRFTKKIRESGILPKIRSSRYKTRSQSDLQKKKTALKKAKSKQKLEYLRKLGKIK